MASHKWQRLGGCTENPGAFDNGNGGMIYRSICTHCGLERETGEDYTGHRPGNTYGPVYTTPMGARVGFIGCSAAAVASIDDRERARQTKVAEARIAELRRMGNDDGCCESDLWGH